ncbi:Fructokinase [Bosea sp. 62]|uniref:carbohydrate kinase family protein n=1 Tax=unclassified Bosea (in: a-proteobacteria) TaxID=2653178 RepID=UPI0012564CAF|nr:MULTISPECIES: carbohydrate kinase [unclassified Bosea (in: a-proteobacteria)]CAD5252962.1 Fructokinase [Bosea sp. 7B]CAD5278394.1 Fructokinase [Bosea sp. 21B]CAD5279473.1 Fructokinase [Bosea sp. 46]VVT59660.1 Fructokinase [Bosea sp. EC-HK365B]VXB38109.1 Fructokinase [Bosea sp. 62]
MILVCGEALVDLFLDPPEGAEMAGRAVAGGSPFNVAIGLARLGLPVGYLGAISRDGIGAMLTERLRQEGVDPRFIVRSDRLSTISAVATGADGQPSYGFHGEGAADRFLMPADLPAALPPQVRGLSFGSYSMAVEPTGATLALLAEREHGRLVISVDPNLRPSVVPDMALWARAAERFYRSATIIKASEEDVRIAWGGTLSLQEAAAYWLGLGAKLVVITRGAEGALGFCADGEVELQAKMVDVRDTVGAGDSFHAALLARLSRTDRLSLEGIATLDRGALGDAMNYAAAAASITVARRGADLPKAVEIEAELARSG